MLMFSRWCEAKIRSDLAQKKSVVLVGSRRVGKTTLVQMIGNGQSTYHTFDDTDLQEVLRQSPKYLERICHRDQLNILDEVQKIPRIFDTLKLLMDRGYLFILTGSSSLHLLEHVSETLAGRIRIRYLTPCCWGEEKSPFNEGASSILFDQSLQANDPLTFRQGQTDLETFLHFGGYPELVNQRHEEKRELLRDYRNTYLQRDILELSNIHDLNAFRALVAALAQSIGSTVSYQHLARESGLSHATAKKYLHALEQTFIVFKLYPYHHGPAKRYLKSPKWYFTDIGLLNSLNLRLAEGQLFENFVIAEAYKRLLLNNRDPDQLFYYRSERGAEIDLIFEDEECLFLFEIKATQTAHSKDLRNLKKFDTSQPYSPNTLVKRVIYRGKEFIQQSDAAFLPVYAWYGMP